LYNAASASDVPTHYAPLVLCLRAPLNGSASTTTFTGAVAASTVVVATSTAASTVPLSCGAGGVPPNRSAIGILVTLITMIHSCHGDSAGGWGLLQPLAAAGRRRREQITASTEWRVAGRAKNPDAQIRFQFLKKQQAVLSPYTRWAIPRARTLTSWAHKTTQT
jgi:hypothetical protein